VQGPAGSALAQAIEVVVVDLQFFEVLLEVEELHRLERAPDLLPAGTGTNSVPRNSNGLAPVRVRNGTRRVTECALPCNDQNTGPISAFGWPFVVQAGGLAQLSGAQAAVRVLPASVHQAWIPQNTLITHFPPSRAGRGDSPTQAQQECSWTPCCP